MQEQNIFQSSSFHHYIPRFLFKTVDLLVNPALPSAPVESDAGCELFLSWVESIRASITPMMHFFFFFFTRFFEEKVLKNAIYLKWKSVAVGWKPCIYKNTTFQEKIKHGVVKVDVVFFYLFRQLHVLSY